jgi:glycosyltransferase involved in cell wall biosynthesis
MKILHTVEFFSPSPGGMQEVVQQISERLCRRGHQVTVATSHHPARTQFCHHGVEIVAFNIQGKAATGLRGEIEKYRNFLLHSDFDIVTNFAAQQWATDIALPILKQIKAKKVFVPTGFSGLYLPAYRSYFEQMKSWMRDYDMNVFLSCDYRDIEFGRQNGVSEMIVIPNGAAAEEFLSDNDIDMRQKLGIQPHQFLILHVGSHTGVKGHDEVISIFKKASLPGSVLLIVGNFLPASFMSESLAWVKNKAKHLLTKVTGNPKKFPLHCPYLCREIEAEFNRASKRQQDGRKILVRSLSRAETIAAYRQADLFLFPSNIECSPIVLFECMASRLPFLATEAGNTREIIAWSHGGLCLPTIKEANGYCQAEIAESAALLAKVYADASQRRQMAEAGFNAWQEKFTWEQISIAYERLYESLRTREDKGRACLL